MTISEAIQQQIQQLPDALQQEVLDFVQFLLHKRAQNTPSNQEDFEWKNFSLASATRGMEDEDTPVYTIDEG